MMGGDAMAGHTLVTRQHPNDHIRDGVLSLGGKMTTMMIINLEINIYPISFPDLPDLANYIKINGDTQNVYKILSVHDTRVVSCHCMI